MEPLPRMAAGIAGAAGFEKPGGSIPMRRARPVHDPSTRIGEPADLLHLGRRKLEIENGQVLREALALGGAGNDDRAWMRNRRQTCPADLRWRSPIAWSVS